MKKKAVYPGSFDPITLGHIDIITRMSKIFDELVVLIAQSSQKHSLFTPLERKKLIEETFKHLPTVKVDIHEGLTVDYVRQNQATTIIRGLRVVVDFEYEMTMASMNRKIAPEIETMLVFASPEYYYISSRAVKEVAQFNGPLDGLVPDHVKQPLLDKLHQKKP